MNPFENSASYRPIGYPNSNVANSSSFCNWLKNLKIYKVVCLVVVLLCVIPFLAHYYVLGVSKTGDLNG